MSRFLPLVMIAMGLLTFLPGWSEPTPPIMPNVQETPLPPAVELPPPPTIPLEVANRPLTATEAAQIALHCQPNLTVTAANVAAAAGIVEQVRSGLYPNLVANLAYSNSLLNNTVAVNSGLVSVGYTTGVTLRQLLYDFNHTRASVQQAVAQEQAASANLTRAQFDLVLQVKQNFYQYVQNLHLVAVNEANVRNQQNHLAEAQARLRAGVGLPIDVVRAETAVSDAIFALNLAQNTASVSRVTLALSMGIDPRTPIEAADSDEPSINTDDLEGLVKQAQSLRPEIAQAQANICASQFGITVAKTGNAPTLYATVGFNQRGANFPPNAYTLGYGLAVSWDVFDSGLTSGRVKTAKADLTAAQATLVSTCQTVISDVSQAYINLRTAEQRVVTATTEVANAEESVRLAQGRYQAGLGIFLDVLDAQTALVTAQTNLINVQTTVNLARAAMAHALGLTPPTQSNI